MIYRRTEKVGIDLPIDKISKRLYSVLSLQWSNIDVYGRVYRNPKDGKVVPEWYVSDGDYKEVLMDDSRGAIIFFDVDPKIEMKTGSYGVAKVDIIVYTNLSKIKNLSERLDHEVHKDLMSILKPKPYGFEIDKLYTTIEKVYSEFKGVSKMLLNKDLSRYHHFKVSGSLSFSTNNC